IPVPNGHAGHPHHTLRRRSLRSRFAKTQRWPGHALRHHREHPPPQPRHHPRASHTNRHGRSPPTHLRTPHLPEPIHHRPAEKSRHVQRRRDRHLPAPRHEARLHRRVRHRPSPAQHHLHA